jgi:hypothetical protein
MDFPAHFEIAALNAIGVLEIACPTLGRAAIYKLFFFSVLSSDPFHSNRLMGQWVPAICRQVVA